MKMILIEKCEHCHELAQQMCAIRGQSYNYNCPLPDAPESEAKIYEHLKDLAVSIWEATYKGEAPDWEPLEDSLGVITQIDNMVAGLIHTPKANPWTRLDPEDRTTWPEAGKPALIVFYGIGGDECMCRVALFGKDVPAVHPVLLFISMGYTHWQEITPPVN